MSANPEVLGWIRKADADLAAARILAHADPPLPDQTGFLCQQAAEKYLKAFLLAIGQEPPRIHDVEVLVEMCASADPEFERLLPEVEGLTEFAVLFRYPEEWSANVTASQTLPRAETVRAFIYDKLGLF